MLVKRDIRRRVDRAAAHFDEADFVHAVTREGLLERLDPLVIDVRTVLDLGAATGSTGRALRKRFRRTHVVSLDLSRPMLMRARRSWLATVSRVQADAERLPFADGAFDLVVTNQLLPWLPDPAQVFSEVARVLKKGGVFAFATLGPDSFRELATAWAAVDDGSHVNRFADMHDIGDALVRARLQDPVLDVDRLSVTYGNPDKLFADLTRAGGRNSLADRGRGLVGRTRFQAMTEALAGTDPDGRIRLDLELVYGHCWGCGPGVDATDFRVDATRIPLRR
ncbi:MAG: methyltransferase domain-containing protein [Woeseiaceae bacterium]